MLLPALKTPCVVYHIFLHTAKRERERGRDTATRRYERRYGAQKYSIPSCQTVSEILRSHGILPCILRENNLPRLATAVFTEYLIATAIVRDRAGRKSR